MTNPITKYWPNGRIKYEFCFIDDENIWIEEYSDENGWCHRDPLEGPASIKYDIHYNKKIIEYYTHGWFHNPYGPAIQTETKVSWYLNGKEYNIEVNYYLYENNLNWRDMDKTDFDIMWSCIL